MNKFWFDFYFFFLIFSHRAFVYVEAQSFNVKQFSCIQTFLFSGNENEYVLIELYNKVLQMFRYGKDMFSLLA